MNAGSTKRRRTGAIPGSRAVTRSASVGVVLLLALVGAAITVVLVRREASVRKEWRGRLVGTAEERKAAILDYLEDRVRDAEVFAAFPSIREMTAGAVGGGLTEFDEHLRAVFEAGRVRWESRTLAFLGPDFSERLRAGEALEPEASELLRHAAPKSSWSALYSTRLGSRVIFAAPVVDLSGGTPGGWIVLVDDAGATLFAHLRREPVATRTGEVLLAGRSGGRLVFLSPLRYRAPGSPPLELPLATAELAARDAAEGREGDGSYLDYRGNRVLAAVRSIPGPGWGLVVKVDADEALAGVARERVWAGTTVLAVVLALVALLRAIRGRERFRIIDEQRLRDEKYRLILERVRDAVFWIRPGDGRILEANRAALALWGYGRDELLGMTVLDLRPPEEAEVARGQMEKARSEGTLFRARHRRRDGSVIPVEVSSRTVDLGDEEVLVSVVRDTSESDAALARVLLMNRIHRTIGAVELALVKGTDRESVLRRTCDELVATGEFTAAWFGAPSDEGFLVPEASAGRIEGFFEEVRMPLGAGLQERSLEATCFVEERSVVAGEWETDPRLGSLCEPGRRRGYRSSVACPVRCGGTVCGVLSVYASEPGVFVPDAVLLLEVLSHDLGHALDLVEAESGRSRAESSLAESEARYRKLFEENPAPMWVFDIETLRILDVNESATQISGWSREELLTRALRDILPPEDVPLLDADVQVPRAGIRKSGPWRRLLKDGSERVVEVFTYDVDFEGRAARLAVASDVTQRLRAEEEARRFNTELEKRVELRTEELLAKSRELESFAYSISHDLRAPLRAIDGFSRAIEEEHADRLDEEGMRLLGIVRSNARRMGQLIDDLLAFSRAGRQGLRRSRVEMGALVTAVLAEVLPEAERETSDVTIGDLPPAQADPALLRQVFVNLLSNAVKFTSTRPRRVLEVSGWRDGGRVIYEVTDNGVGFDMRYANKLFGVFQRLHGREFEGTGVGLALVERIVTRHGGTVTARGEVGQGATFTVSLPDEGACS